MEAMKMVGDKQTSISNKSLFLELYSSISSIVNLFISSQDIQVANCSIQNSCLQCYQNYFGLHAPTII